MSTQPVSHQDTHSFELLLAQIHALTSCSWFKWLLCIKTIEQYPLLLNLTSLWRVKSSGWPLLWRGELLKKVAWHEIGIVAPPALFLVYISWPLWPKQTSVWQPGCCGFCWERRRSFKRQQSVWRQETHHPFGSEAKPYGYQRIVEEGHTAGQCRIQIVFLLQIE